MSADPCFVFAKPPVPGQVKTRIGACTGHDTAARIAAALLSDTVRLVRSVDALRPVLSTPEPTSDHGLVAAVAVQDQGGGDLGARLERTLRAGLATSAKAIAIGADAPHVPREHLAQALVALDAHDAVLGPTSDGGFYLLGLRWCPDGLLADLPWSAPTTAHATRTRLVERGLTVAALPPWWDVDELADLRRFVAEVEVGAAPATHAVLATLSL